MFEIKEVHAAITRYWPFDEDYFDKGNDEERETYTQGRLSKQIEALAKEIERLKCLNAKMLREMQDMAKKMEHVSTEVDDMVEALRPVCQSSDHDNARQQANLLQRFLS